MSQNLIKFFTITCVSFFLSTVFVYPQDLVGDPVKGKALFNTNCAACHKLDKKMTGPPLAGISQKYEKEWLYKWIRNSAGMIKDGDADAVKIWEEYNKVPMNSFPLLSDKDIEDIIAYTDQPPKKKVVKTEGLASNEESRGMTDTVQNMLLLTIAVVFLMLVITLIAVTKKVKMVLGETVPPTDKIKKRVPPIIQSYLENTFLKIVTVIFLLLLGAYFTYSYFMQLGVDQGYQPIQPIHFSHKIHAGDNQIECQFCHSSARNSKHSGIPSLNVCMNCHKNISDYNGDENPELKFTKEKYTAEIKKIYDAIGWDENLQSYTGKTKPIKWVRVHNLPDFVYFNHSQHVTVAGISCQECHGQVQEMEILSQHAPLTMGWCIDCHRKTDVNLKGNAYYKKIHSELAKKYGIERLTIAEMGGLECGKCHY